MVGRNHMMTSAAAGLVASQVPSVADGAPVLVICAVCAIAGLLPDIDTPSSTISRLLGGHYLHVRHRTITHTVWALLPWLALWRLSGVGAFAWILVGYLTHLVMDSLSRGGVCWLWPLTRYLDETRGYTYHVAPGYHRPKLYLTGTWQENVLAVIVTLMLALVWALT